VTVARAAPNIKAFFAGAKDLRADSERRFPDLRLAPKETEKLMAPEVDRYSWFGR